jgi:hypothetical protein
MSERVLLRFRAQYDGSLLDNQHLEYAPVLMVSSSMRGRQKHFQAVKWQNAAKTLSEWLDMELELPAFAGENYEKHSNTYLVRPDDTISFQAKVTTPNEDGEDTFQSVGDGLLTFGLELGGMNVKKLSEWQHNIDLTFSMLYNKQGERVKKGSVEVKEFSAVLESTGRPVKISVNPAEKLNEFSFTAQNEALFSSVVRDMMVRSITMFTQDAVEANTAFLPSSDEVKRVHAPFFHLPAGLAPGMAYLMAPNATKIVDQPERLARVEAWMHQIVSYALNRENMREDTFITVVNEQLARTDNTYDDRVTACAAILGQALALPPTELPYISDFVRTGARTGAHKLACDKNGFVEFNNKELHAVERFSEMVQNNGGDCEDGGCFACRIGNVLALNEFKTPLVRAASALARQYVMALSLGSVRSASLGNDKHDKKTSAATTTFIDSAEDRAVNYGAHMWCEAIPLAKTVALIQRSVTDLDPNLLWLPGASRAPWTAALPHLVIEATGRLSSLLLPATEYIVTGGKEEKEALVARLAIDKALDKHIDDNTVTFGQMKVVRQQEMVTPQPDKRSTSFYRDTTHLFTTSFFEVGIPIIDFVWANRGKRVSAKDAWANTRKFELSPLSAQMIAPGAAAASSSIAAAKPLNSVRAGSLIPCSKLGELNAITALIGNKSLPDNASAAAPPRFFYGVPLEDKLQCPLLPATALVPGTPLSQREFRVLATLLRHSPPIDAPGDFVQIEAMHEARIKALLNEGIDELAREKFEDRQFERLVEGVRIATGNAKEKEWPVKPSSRWTLKTNLFSTRMFNIEQGDKVADAITADVKKMTDAGIVKFARVMLEAALPHRRTVMIQLLCNATKAV